MDKWAILVGVQKYFIESSLNYTEADVSEIRKAFIDSCQFPNDHITMLSDSSDKQPIRGLIFNELEIAKNKVKADDLLVFYFSGHGMCSEDGKDYLLPPDAASGTVKNTGIAVRDIIDNLKETRCNNVVMFLDACRLTSTGAKGLDQNSIGADSEQALRDRKGIVTFFSCSPRETSYEIDELKHGSFTYNLLEAFKDRTCTTIAKIDEYLRVNVPRTNKLYHKLDQMPYTVVEPNEKNLQTYFVTTEQIRVLEEKAKELNGMLTELWLSSRLETDLFCWATHLVDSTQIGFRNHRQKMIYDLVEGFCRGDPHINISGLRAASQATDNTAIPSQALRE
jgi:uncharacterized caspase-like protein